MSDDICERLVRFSKHKQCMSTDLEVEAAAEITRLREEVERLKSEESCNDVLLEYAQAENVRLREENARLREAVKAAYYEGWQDNASIDDTEDRLHAEWEYSEACAAIREGGNNERK